eukprot:CAMPEP_0194304672 /NCGR_PEP_ID=MMETSP0171-20130528/2347_1 /TAXON_ID=218684 /ORGANISM="Corethron pennatum, Strain L29A3" /LENGTH=736 /DNA_ID=CAMNT_0039056015 /DNA_START=162 /DNA_END=2372 /DNA_ORIENTATION=+
MKFQVGESTILVSALAFATTHVSTAFVAPTSNVFKTRRSIANSDRSSLSLLPPTSAADVDIEALTNVLGSSSLSISDVSFESVISSPLFTYLAEKVIDASIPALFSAAVIFFASAQFRKAQKASGGGMGEDEQAEASAAISELYNDLYSSTAGKPQKRGPMNPFGGPPGPPPLPKNLGIPKTQFLKITNMNERYDAYDFSLAAATDSKAKAAAVFRAKAFDRALGLALNAEPTVEGSTVAEFLAPRVKQKLITIEKEYLKKAKVKFETLQKVESTLAAMAMDIELAILGKKAQEANAGTGLPVEDPTVIDVQVVTNTTETSASSSNDEIALQNKKAMKEAAASSANDQKAESAMRKKDAPKKDELIKETTKLQTELKVLELDLIQQVLAAVGPKRAIAVRNALLGDIAVRGAGSLLSSIEARPLSALLKDGGTDATRQKSLFVMNFPGDVQASQLNELREEITGVIRNAKPGDEALVVLSSGGGTVTGYGLAAGQLVRLKDKGLKLTIAVEQVAASGGYMMSCVADKIIASPFAVIGSIGVISEVPNVYERLNKEGIQFQTVTAGKFKRTLTPTKKITPEDVAKSEEDIGEIFELFKGWVALNRPSLNIDEVATGETWFGPAALEKGLCDEIKTVDDVLLDYVTAGYNIYEVKYEPPPEIPSTLQALFASEDQVPTVGGGDTSFGRRAIRWLVRSFAEEVQAVTNSVGNTPLQEKYMARDDTQDRVKASSDDSNYY